MNFFERIPETRITRGTRRPPCLPPHRRLFPVEPCAREIARAAVREVLG